MAKYNVEKMEQAAIVNVIAKTFGSSGKTTTNDDPYPTPATNIKKEITVMA